LSIGDPDSPLEREAERVAQLVTSSQRVKLTPGAGQRGTLQREEAGIIPAPPLEIDIPKAALSRPLPERKEIGPHGTYPVENPSADPCSKEERCKLFISGSNIDFHRYARGQETAKRQELKKQGASIEPSPGPQMTAFLKKEVPQASTYLREVLVDPALGEGAGAWHRACPDDPKADCVAVAPKWEEEALTYNADPAAQFVGETKGKPKTRAEWRFTTRQMLTHEAAHARFNKQPPAGTPKFDGTLTRETISYKELSELFAQLSEFPLFYEEGMSGEATRSEKLKRVRQLYTDRYLQRTMKITEDIPGILLRLRCLNSCSEVDTMLGSVLRNVTQGWQAEVRQALTTILTDPSLGLHWPAPPQPSYELKPEPEGLRFQENPLRKKPATNSSSRSEPVDGLVRDALDEGSQPLSPATRAYMEPRFGYDFSQVRVHTGERAAESARSVNALAYTLGGDVVFGAGQYAPTTSSGQKLLAHELAHVIQQENQGVAASEAPVLHRKVSPDMTIIRKNLTYGIFDWAITDSEARGVLGILKGLSPEDLHDTVAAMQEEDLVTRFFDNLPDADAKQNQGFLDGVRKLAVPQVYVHNTELGGLSVGNFDFHFKNCAILVWTWLKFQFTDDINPGERTSFKQRFIKAVHKVWANTGYSLSGSNGCPCSNVPITIHAAESAGGYHHKLVDVERKSDEDRRPKVLSDININLGSSDETFAHEFGHVLGLYDEYDGGFFENIMFWHQNQNDPYALMSQDWQKVPAADQTKASQSTELRPRYFEQYREEVQKGALKGCTYTVSSPKPPAS
jgi:Domain of unknown function (DUF4157)